MADLSKHTLTFNEEQRKLSEAVQKYVEDTFKLIIYKVEIGDHYEGVFEEQYFSHHHDARKFAETKIEEKMKSCQDAIKRNPKLHEYYQPYRADGEDKWTARHDYMEIIEIEVKQ